MVAHPVERLSAKVERSESDLCSPNGVVVALRQVRREGVLAGVAARAVAAIMTECDRLGERDVEPGGVATAVATCATSRAWVNRVR